MWVYLDLLQDSPCTLVSFLPPLPPEEKWKLLQMFLGKPLWAQKGEGVYSVFQDIQLDTQTWGVALGIPASWRGRRLVCELSSPL